MKCNYKYKNMNYKLKNLIKYKMRLKNMNNKLKN